jgi:outer membrane protein assembly factor BamA
MQPEFDEAGRAVSLVVRINEGPQVRIAEITVVGNEHVSESLIREELGLTVGAPLSGTALLNSQQRLYDMGVFRRASVAPADRIGGEVDARIIVSVVEAPATTVGVGGGLEGRRVTYQVAGVATEQLEFAPRGFFEIGRQNLGGRNRSIGFFSRLSLRASGSDAEDADFTEYRTALTYRERRLFRTNTEVLVSGVSEQSRRSSFNFKRQSVNAELFHRATGRVAVIGRYRLDFTRLFDVQDGIPPEDRPIIDRLFPQVRLSSVGTGVAWDRRDNPLAPAHGTFMTADVQVAARSLGSEVGFVKTFAQASYFHPLNNVTVVALRGEVGLARGFERNALVRDDNGDPVLGPDGTPLVETVRDLPISERFFAGGNTTVRGFQLDRLGSEDVFVQNVPIGGNGLLVFNAELRRRLALLFGRDFGVVAFVDSGNVFPDASDVNVTRIRGAAGFGARWDSPVGPLRLDFGFKMTREVISGVRESGWEYHLSIGEAF